MSKKKNKTFPDKRNKYIVHWKDSAQTDKPYDPDLRMRLYFHCKLCLRFLFVDDEKCFTAKDNGNNVYVHNKGLIKKNIYYDKDDNIFCGKCDLRIGRVRTHSYLYIFLRNRIVTVWKTGKRSIEINDRFVFHNESSDFPTRRIRN